MQDDAQVAALHQQLIVETDNDARAKIHMNLGELAMRAGRFPQASRHYREALLLDQRLDEARDALRSLGEWVDRKVQRRSKSGILSMFFHQLGLR